MSQVNDLLDMLDVCRSKLAFLSDVFSQDTLKTFRFSEDGLAGFYFILSDLESDVVHVMNELKQREEVRK